MVPPVPADTPLDEANPAQLAGILIGRPPDSEANRVHCLRHLNTFLPASIRVSAGTRQAFMARRQAFQAATVRVRLTRDQRVRFGPLFRQPSSPQDNYGHVLDVTDNTNAAS